MGNWYDPYLLLEDPVIVADDQHRVLAVNPAYEEATGYRAQDLVGKDAVYMTAEWMSVVAFRSMSEQLKKGESWKGIFTSRRADGRLWNCSLTITPVRSLYRLYYLGVCRDVEDVTYQNIAESYEQLFFLIAHLAETGDPSVEPHLYRVSRLSTFLAQWLGWSDGRAKCLGLVSVLHDVGKLYIPREILFKPGPLTPEERRLVETHTTKGAELLGRFSEKMAKIYGYNEALLMAREIAEYHHEQVDGNGYPKGLRGEEIPESARIVALADVTDALFSHRPYKTAWDSSKVQEYLRAKQGSQFDPVMVDIFLEHWEEVEKLYLGNSAVCVKSWEQVENAKTCLPCRASSTDGVTKGVGR